jgi:peptidoglycan hydrolase-like protein with peptidoglycan-binding domain
VDAQAALAAAVATASSSPASSTTPSTVTTPTLLATATAERVQQAEDDLARAGRGINDETALIDAGAAYNSAALALEIAWLSLLNEAECFSEARQAEAVAQLTSYTTAVQKDLQAAGYDPGPIDGVYGPETAAAVQRLQTDNGLPVTGFIDEATARALQEKLDTVGQQDAAQIAQLQTILTLTGYWAGPVDGKWTDELTQALKEFQTSLGVQPTGTVDSATVAAFQQALAAAKVVATSTAIAPTVETTVTAPVVTTTETAPATTATTTVTAITPATS